jgi:processive 1,2-diacylglycerol beta-glucosyltransferase
MLKKVLLLSASAGAGHIRAAQALEKAFNQLEPTLEVRHLDVLDYTNKVFRHLYSKAYIELVNKMPEVPGWMYDKLDTPWKNERRRLALDKLNTRPHCLYALPAGGDRLMVKSKGATRKSAGNSSDGL